MMSRTVTAAKPISANTCRAPVKMVSRFCALVSSRRLSAEVFACASMAGTLTNNDDPSISHADRCCHIRKAIARETAQQLAFDTANQARPLEDQRCVKLDQRRPGTDLRIGIFTTVDAAHPD